MQINWLIFLMRATLALNVLTKNSQYSAQNKLQLVKSRFSSLYYLWNHSFRQSCVENQLQYKMKSNLPSTCFAPTPNLLSVSMCWSIIHHCNGWYWSKGKTLYEMVWLLKLLQSLLCPEIHSHFVNSSPRKVFGLRKWGEKVTCLLTVK